MHPYATDDPGRRHVPLVLAVVAAVLALLTSTAIGMFGSPPWWVEVPSVIGWYGLLWYGFNRWLWATKACRALGLVETPDLRGRWTATLTSSYDNHDVLHEAAVEIRQTWSSISIRLKSDGSRSVSTSASIVTDGPDFALVYQYKNTPAADRVSTMHAHTGAVELHLSDDGTTLEGQYYSGRGRQTVGRIQLVS